jgi:tetratricopeptide (TPR) repeat protein
MTAPPPSVVAPTRRRRLLLAALVVVLLGGAAGAGAWVWHRNAQPALTPPEPDLEGVDPAVAAVLDRERQAVLQSPRAPSAWGRFGEALMLYNYRSEAVICFAEAERLAPHEPRWPYFQGYLLHIDNPSQAVSKLRRAVELSGDLDALRLRLAETLLAQGHLDEAEEGFLQLQARDSTNPRVQLGLGRLALQRQRPRDALPFLQRATPDPRTARGATIALAEAYQRLGDEEAAARERRRLESLPSDPPWPDKFLDEVQRFSTGKRARLMQADQLFKQRRIADALSQYDKVVRDYPDSHEAWTSLGQALYQVRDYANAERALQKAVDLAPGFAEARNYLGLAQVRQGELTEAAASFRKAIDLKPDFALAYANLGSCCLQQKDTAGAREAFRSAVRCMPNYAGARIELALLLHQEHQDAEALEQARAALQLNPDDERARKLVAELSAKDAHSPKR